ncbi:thymidine phosphorylase family protein [Sandaracinobacteroides sp. A072]|uniref:thymidine phosphorylase family protein n=1 Tax=Sandaracinobacteroides sp. A072 TaxID=3461146 RepID=UPI00404116FF
MTDSPPPMPAGAPADVDPAADSGPAHLMVRARTTGLVSIEEPMLLMHPHSHVCRAEGLSPRSRVQIFAGDQDVIATLYQLDSPWLEADEALLSGAAARRLAIADGDPVRVRHAPPVESLADVRRRVHGGRLHARAFDAIIADIVAGRYADVDLATFIVACSAFPLDREEICHLTRALVETGDRLEWGAPQVIDKHCVGGLPGNRTTPIVVAILASLGLVVPKTSSRAITSPAGTADTMETLAPVALDLATMRRVVEQEGGCLAWGGSVRLAPADDLLIRIERAIDIDTEGQLVASILSKKIAAGSTHVLIDLPVGPTAKVRTHAAARSLARELEAVGRHFGLKVRCVETDGLQPVGRGIGPALEARDVLAVLGNTPDAPADLRERALLLAGEAVEMAGLCAPGGGIALAREALLDGRARTKFERICEAQGGIRTPPIAAHRRAVAAPRSGILSHIDNRRLSRLAKLAGAPDDKAAGLELHHHLGDEVRAGDPLVTVHATSTGELAYALDYAAANPRMFDIET